MLALDPLARDVAHYSLSSGTTVSEDLDDVGYVVSGDLHRAAGGNDVVEHVDTAAGHLVAGNAERAGAEDLTGDTAIEGGVTGKRRRDGVQPGIHVAAHRIELDLDRAGIVAHIDPATHVGSVDEAVTSIPLDRAVATDAGADVVAGRRPRFPTPYVEIAPDLGREHQTHEA